MQNDDIEDFDLRWEQALLLTRDPPSDKVVEGLHVSNFSSSDNYGTIKSRNSAMKRKTRLSQTKNVYEIASKNFRIESEITGRVAVTTGKGQNSFSKRKTGECFQWKANGSCSKGDSCSFLHSHALGNRETSAEEVGNARVSGLQLVVNNSERSGKGKE